MASTDVYYEGPFTGAGGTYFERYRQTGESSYVLEDYVKPENPEYALADEFCARVQAETDYVPFTTEPYRDCHNDGHVWDNMSKMEDGEKDACYRCGVEAEYPSPGDGPGHMPFNAR